MGIQPITTAVTTASGSDHQQHEQDTDPMTSKSIDQSNFDEETSLPDERNENFAYLKGHEIRYPAEPPPAYSSGDHTPEEHPLIDEDDGSSITEAAKADVAIPDDKTGNGERSADTGDYVTDENISAQSNMEQIAPLSSEEKDLLQMIESYTASTIRIQSFLKPFMPEYIPAVGDVDAFIKIPRPDEVDDELGLTVLDEPAAKQSDPTILGMQLRNEMKTPAARIEISVKKLARADQNSQEIEHWITSIKELHRMKPGDTVYYSKPMPDIEQLMQEWHGTVEAVLKNEQLPLASLDVPLEEYVDVCMALVDIPVHRSRIQALHVLFTLFAEFRNSQHFRNLSANNLISNALKDGTNDQPQRLEL